MARRRKKNNFFIIGGVIIAVGAIGFYFWNRAQQKKNQDQLLALLQQRNLPTRPANNTPAAIAAWVSTLSSVYGNIKVLWEPGGPFYKNPNPSAQAVLDALSKLPPGYLGA